MDRSEPLFYFNRRYGWGCRHCGCSFRGQVGMDKHREHVHRQWAEQDLAAELKAKANETLGIHA